VLVKAKAALPCVSWTQAPNHTEDRWCPSVAVSTPLQTAVKAAQKKVVTAKKAVAMARASGNKKVIKTAQK